MANRFSLKLPLASNRDQTQGGVPEIHTRDLSKRLVHPTEIGTRWLGDTYTRPSDLTTTPHELHPMELGNTTRWLPPSLRGAGCLSLLGGGLLLG
jgi:hypothetical protein